MALLQYSRGQADTTDQEEKWKKTEPNEDESTAYFYIIDENGIEIVESELETEINCSTSTDYDGETTNDNKKPAVNKNLACKRKRYGAKLYTCECGKAFTRKEGVIRHNKLNKHKKTNKHKKRASSKATEKKFSCNECGSAFTTKTNLAIHEEIHSGAGSYTCDRCGKSLSRPKTLLMHKRWCNIGASNNLKPNMKMHFDDECKVIACDVCGARFSHQCGLTRHMGKHTPSQAMRHMKKRTSNQVNLQTDKNPEKPFICHECGFTFTQEAIFAKHKLIHSFEEMFVCDICGMKFMHQSGLKHHTKKGTVCGNKLESEAILKQPSTATNSPSTEGEFPETTSVKSELTSDEYEYIIP